MMPTRLPFALPDRTRIQWASAAAREIWQPRIQAIGRAWQAIERAAVEHGTRDGALLFPSPAELLEVAAWAAPRRLVALPLTREGASGASYAAASHAFQEGKPWHYRVALTRPETAGAWLEAARAGDDDAIGALLGFPACCRAFFQRAWVADRWTDPTWPAAIASGDPVLEVGRGGSRLVVDIPADTPAAANILLRWFGLRAVPHLPCGFGCQATAAFAEALDFVGRLEGFERELDDLREILAWPVEWSALHGIAEVKTPIAKLATRTDATAETLVVRKRGSRYPAEGANGIGFPFQASTVIPITSLRKFRQAFESTPARPPVQVGSTPLAWPPAPASTAWTDNGFASREGMERAHGTVAAVLEAPVETALDLGCGNGALLERLARVRGHGVEIDEGRARRAHDTTHRIDLRIVVGDATDPATWHVDRVDLVVLMPGRWLEGRHKGMPAATLAALRQVAPRALVYAYGDWLRPYGGSLERLTVAAGLSWNLVKERRAADVSAAVIRL